VFAIQKRKRISLQEVQFWEKKKNLKKSGIFHGIRVFHSSSFMIVYTTF